MYWKLGWEGPDAYLEWVEGDFTLWCWLDPQGTLPFHPVISTLNSSTKLPAWWIFA